jgi:membrane protein implicated in regulation of membrane protease activity
VEDSVVGDFLEVALASASLIAMFWSLRRRIVGLEGIVIEGPGPYALITVNGQKWRAVASDGSHLRPGERVTVVRVQGLQLAVVSRESPTVAPIQAR